MFYRFLCDDTGQDVVEYALLGALIGIAAIVTWQQLAATVGVVYGDADVAQQGLSALSTLSSSPSSRLHPLPMSARDAFRTS